MCNFRKKKYSHSVIYSCQCIKMCKPPRMISNYDINDLEILLERECCVEYRYYKQGFLHNPKTVKIQYCMLCKSYN